MFLWLCKYVEWNHGTENTNLEVGGNENQQKIWIWIRSIQVISGWNRNRSDQVRIKLRQVSSGQVTFLTGQIFSRSNQVFHFKSDLIKYDLFRALILINVVFECYSGGKIICYSFIDYNRSDFIHSTCDKHIKIHT